jgi:hypothetical protein
MAVPAELLVKLLLLLAAIAALAPCRSLLVTMWLRLQMPHRQTAA